jgi:hypothetical protein
MSRLFFLLRYFSAVKTKEQTTIEDPQGLHQFSSLLSFEFLLSFLYFSFVSRRLSRLVVVVRCVSTCWETVINITPWSLNVFYFYSSCFFL